MEEHFFGLPLNIEGITEFNFKMQLKSIASKASVLN
jgi:hypothetical protein